MRKIERLPQHRQDIERLDQRGKSAKHFQRYAKLTALLAQDKNLPPLCDDHPLRAPWQDFRSFKVQSDWLVYYRKEPGVLILARTGEHTYLKFAPAPQPVRR